MKNNSTVEKFVNTLYGLPIREKVARVNTWIYTEDARNAAKTANIHIAKGNTKTGSTEAFSVYPVVTCSAYACSTCGNCNGSSKTGACYALKSLIRKTVNVAWIENTLLAIYEKDRLESQLNAYFAKRNGKIRYFRLHVAGDFVDVRYLAMWARIASTFINIKFYTYTKSFDTLEMFCRQHETPENLVIKLSDWPGMREHEKYAELVNRFKVAYVDNGKIDYIPHNAYRCKGSGKKDDPNTCETCGYICANPRVNVVFPIH